MQASKLRTFLYTSTVVILLTHLMTVLAQYVDEEVLVFLWHRRDGNLIVQIVPQLFHIEHGLLTSRACIIARHEQLLEASSVEEMAARRYMARYP